MTFVLSLVPAIAGLVLVLPVAPAAPTPSILTPNGPTLCVILPFLPQCKFI